MTLGHAQPRLRGPAGWKAGPNLAPQDRWREGSNPWFPVPARGRRECVTLEHSTGHRGQSPGRQLDRYGAAKPVLA